jgi:hypothetical protein
LLASFGTALMALVLLIKTFGFVIKANDKEGES